MAEQFVDRRAREIRERGPTVPLDYGELKREAREHLAEAVYDYVAGGAGTEGTVRRNRAAFGRWRIRPRVLRDVAERDLSTELLGCELAAPVGVAPVGSHRAYHPGGEAETARAAADLGVPFALSTGASETIEAVAEAGREATRTTIGAASAPPDGGDAPQFFQLYWPREWDVAASLVERAEAAGYDGVVLTLDSQLTKWRRRNLENDFALSDVTTAETLAGDPAVEELAAERGVGVGELLGSDALDKDPTLTWSDLSWLRERTELPVVLKGILDPADARLAVEHGGDGVIVSSHGGRQIDGARAAVAALPGVVEAVDGEVPVLLDSGVRTGAEAFVALALGADAVFVGRPFVFGLAIAGRRGVYEVLANVIAELDSVLGLSGHDAVTDVGREALVRERARSDGRGRAGERAAPDR